MYKPGSENIVPDCLSRIEDENNVDHEAEDYLDNLVAVIDNEHSESEEETHAIEVVSSENESNANSGIIAQLPASTNMFEF